MGTTSTKAAVQFVKATDRDRCGNCKHIERTYVDRTPPWDKAGWACGKNGFATTAGAICAVYEADKTRPPPRFN